MRKIIDLAEEREKRAKDGELAQAMSVIAQLEERHLTPEDLRRDFDAYTQWISPKVLRLAHRLWVEELLQRTGLETEEALFEKLAEDARAQVDGILARSLREGKPVAELDLRSGGADLASSVKQDAFEERALRLFLQELYLDPKGVLQRLKKRVRSKVQDVLR